MNDEPRRRSELDRIGVVWPARWGEKRLAEFATAVRDFAPDVVSAGVDEFIATTDSNYCPPPAKLREHCETKRRQMRDARRDRERLEAEQAEPAEPHVAVMWTAALWAAMRARGTPVVMEEFEPYIALAEKHGLRPEHGVDDHPDYDGPRVTRAEREFRDLLAARGMYEDRGLDATAVTRELLRLVLGTMGGRAA